MLKFFNEDISFKLSATLRIKNWIKTISKSEGYKIGELNYIFCSDDYLLGINREYLDHDYYTDIITFDNSEDDNLLEGDIFISIDRVKDNAQTLAIELELELRRVIIHGLLHLVGFQDETDDLKQIMRAKEDECLELF